MNESMVSRHNTLRTRLLLLFLFIVAFILAVTLFIVRQATYEHSNQQVLNHSITSASIVQDKINNQSELLETALADIAKNFSVIRLIAGANDDPASLVSAMQNYQQRLATDFFIVLDAEQQAVVSSESFAGLNLDFTFGAAETRWINLQNKTYLLSSAPVKFVQTSRNINGWILMGVETNKLFNQELVELTGLEVTLMRPGQTNQILGSTLPDEKLSELKNHSVIMDAQLHPIQLADSHYIYDMIGLDENSPYFILLATNEEDAYLSYYDLLGQLIVVLVIASLTALIAAMMLSNSITSPILKLVEATNQIRQGEFAKSFPSGSTREVDSLSFAIKGMQDSIVEREEQIQELAYFDKLTSLPNRNQFNEKLTQSIADAASNKESNRIMVAMMDVDRFKDINDTVGHDTGDKLLQLIADRLRHYSEGKDFYARIGGDEYGLIFSESNGHSPETIASEIAELFDKPFNLEGLILDVSVSIGVAIYPFDAEDAQGLMQCADIALYSCKDHHHSYAIYKPELNKHSMQRLNLMSELKEALAAGQLELYYQPKLSISANQFESIECLIRWIHPVHGFIPPDEFIGLAEQTGAIRYVTHWALREALMQQRKWSQQGYTFNMAVNISALDLVDMKLPAYVSELLSEFNVQPNMLTLEVTESAIMGDPESAIKALKTLRRMGIILSIDDFGTGFSSMAQLKKMPVDELKIDKAFVLELASNQDDKVMVKTLVALADNLGLKTVAEGVEDQDALDYLEQIGCTKAQGYHLSRPLSISHFNEWYAEHLKTKGQENTA